MGTKNPRVNVMFDGTIYQILQRFAKLDNVSLSQKINELVCHSLEEEEDQYASSLADARLKSFARKNALRHHDIFK